MEAIDREDIDPKTILSNQESHKSTDLTKDEIVYHIQTTIDGCCNSISVPNNFASWKNTAKGLAFIKHIEKDFYKGVELWITLTQTAIMKCDDDSILKSMVNNFPWINSILLLKDHMKKLNES